MTEQAERKDTIKEFHETVNMAPSALEKWLESEHSREVGDSHAPGGGGGESTGHKSGRRIIDLLRTKQADLDADDPAHMRKVVSYVHRHLAQKPSGDVKGTKWRYSLMNWGHDPLKR